jgi:hypothetical protein
MGKHYYCLIVPAQSGRYELFEFGCLAESQLKSTTSSHFSLWGGG